MPLIVQFLAGTEVSPALFPTINLDEVVQTQVRHTRDVTYQERDSFLNSLDLDLDYEPAGEVKIKFILLFNEQRFS